MLFLFLFVEMNHNCRRWTPNRRQATSSKKITDIANAWCMVFLEKEMYLEVVENLKILTKRQWIYLHLFAPRCSITMRSMHYLHIPLPQVLKQHSCQVTWLFWFFPWTFSRVNRWKLQCFGRTERLRIIMFLPKLNWSFIRSWKHANWFIPNS